MEHIHQLGLGFAARRPAERGRPGRLHGAGKRPKPERDKCEAVVRTLTGGRTRFDDASQLPDGLLVHLAWEADDGFWIVDVFDSPEAFDRFAKTLRPIAQAAGITEPLEPHDPHTTLWR